MRRLLIVPALLLLASGAAPCRAQSTQEEKDKEALATLEQMREAAKREELKPPKLPEGEGAWVVLVISRGGILGVGRGDVALNSLGEVVCKPEKACAGPPRAGALKSLSEAAVALATKKAEIKPGSACNDCYSTMLTLQRREPDGKVRTYAFHWDDLSAAQLPADVLRLYDAATAAARPD